MSVRGSRGLFRDVSYIILDLMVQELVGSSTVSLGIQCFTANVLERSFFFVPKISEDVFYSIRHRLIVFIMIIVIIILIMMMIIF